jgi:hypothetical protein
MSIEVPPHYAAAAMCPMVMLNLLANIFKDIVSRVKVCPRVGLIKITREFAPERAAVAV